MSKKRSSRKRGGRIRQDYRKGGRVQRVGAYNGGSANPKPSRGDYPTGADFNVAMANWYASGGPSEPPRVLAHEGGTSTHTSTYDHGTGKVTWNPHNPNHVPEEEDPDAVKAERIERTGERTEEMAEKEGDFAGDPALVGKSDEPDFEDLTRQFNQSEAAQTHGLTVTYDPETNEYVRDNSGAGFTGDDRYTRYNPAEFAKMMGTSIADLPKTEDPALQTQDADVETLDTYVDIGPIDGVTAEQMTAAQGTVEAAIARDDITAADYEAALAEELSAISPAVGSKPAETVISEIRALTTAATAAARDADQEAAAKATAAQRPTETSQGLIDQFTTKYGDVSTSSPSVDADGNITWLDEESGESVVVSPAEFASMHELDVTQKQYVEGAEGAAAEIAAVDDPTVETREGQEIGEEELASLREIAKGRGVPIEELPEYEKAIARIAQTGTAATGEAQDLGEAPEAVAAEAEFEGADRVTGEAATIATEGEFDAAAREGITGTAAEAPDAAQFEGPTPEAETLERDAITGEVIEEAADVQTDLDDLPAYKVAATRTAQVGEAAQRIATELGTAPSADLEGREAILGEAPQGDAAQIGGIPTMAAAQMEAVTGVDRSVSAADMMEVVAEIPPEVTAALSDDPATVEAQIDAGDDPEVIAAVAALPEEALVSVQMSKLLEGMEEGETPLWARPAVAQVEQMMAQRGLSVSTVGRDALFNAIIQSALPMAQGNAQALQQRAAQRLSNEQQANLQQAQQTQQIRMENLSNRQISASQTAQMSQQIKVQRGQFRQEAVITTAQQGQQTRMATAQFAQQRAQQESQQQQQAAIAELNTNAQMDLANLQALNAAGAQNLNAEQQARLTTYNAGIQRTMRQADLKQDMEKANLSTSLQVELANLSEQNLAARDTMSAENQERLTNLQTLVDFKKTDAAMAQQMDLANMSNEQQMNLANLAERAAEDTANFTEENRFELQRLTTYAQFMSENTQLLQQTELANFSGREKINLANLAAMNQASSENLSVAQQAELANLESKLKVGTLNAQMKQQIVSQDFSQKQQMEIANLEQLNRAAAETMSADQQGRLAEYNAQIQRKMRQADLNQDMEKANLDAGLKVELSELSERNTTSRANMTAEQQTRLANLNVLVDFRKTDAAMAQQMDMANMANEQQMELANLAERSAEDAANFTEDNRFRMQELNTTVQVLSQNQALLQQADLANLSMSEKVSLANLHSRNQADSESMSAENIAELTQYQKKMESAQVNAQLAQQMGIENLSNAQQAAMFNAQIDANMDIKQFDFNQQASLANSQFMQSMTIKDFDARQTSAMQNATALAQLDLAAVDQRTKLSITNANNFLQMDMANLNNEQQGVIIDAQLAQQLILSDQSAENAALQFNATSENQVNEFNNSLATQMRQFNTSQANSMEQFNTAEDNRMEAINAGNTLDADKFTEQIGSQLAMFDKEQDYRRDAWNAANAQAIEQSNVTWRRNANTINTAAQNEVNRQNAAYSFQMTRDAQGAMWQELRDQATFDFQSGETQKDRMVNSLVSAMGNEEFWRYMSGTQFKTLRDGMVELASELFGEDLSD